MIYSDQRSRSGFRFVAVYDPFHERTERDFSRGSFRSHFHLKWRRYTLTRPTLAHVGFSVRAKSLVGTGNEAALPLPADLHLKRAPTRSLLCRLLLLQRSRFPP